MFQNQRTNLSQQRKRQLDGVVNYSKKNEHYVFTKVGNLSYETEAKYLSVEVLPIQSWFKVHHGFPICNKSLKATLQAAQRTKRGKLKM
ncbi:hypothetical protein VNO77_01881 [Canavalia gladiata]|uniref:Uncharacterized protein n=1 Tax=Canavalia gladiata TaxID=3824 RepID=A0AAN9RAQ8_CANGL